MTGVNVNYTPDNVLSLTPNNFVQAVKIDLSFSEMTTMTRQDIHEIEDTATAAEWGWIEAQESDVDVSAVYTHLNQYEVILELVHKVRQLIYVH